MNWSDIPTHPANRTLRQFAAAWLVFLAALGFRQYSGLGHHTAGVALIALGLAFGLLGLAEPKAVRWLFVGCMVLAFPIGWVVSLLSLIVVYFGILTPVAVFFRWRGRDMLHRKAAPAQSSFWAPKEMPQDVRRYFRQF